MHGRRRAKFGQPWTLPAALERAGGEADKSITEASPSFSQRHVSSLMSYSTTACNNNPDDPSCVSYFVYDEQCRSTIRHVNGCACVQS